MVNNDNALIERLRFEQVIRKYDDGRTLTQKLNPDGNDAANRIEALSAENERLKKILRDCDPESMSWLDARDAALGESDG